MDSFHLAKIAFLLTMHLLIAIPSFAAEKFKTREQGMNDTANRLLKIATETQTLCLGRFLIDVPRNAEVIYGPARVPVYLSRFEGEGKDLARVVEHARALVSAHRKYAEDELNRKESMLGKVLDWAGAYHKMVFDVDNAIGSYYNVRSFIGVGEDLYMQEYPVNGEDNAYLEAVDLLTEVARSLRSRANDEIPNEPGICLDGAFLREPSRYMLEEVTLGIRLKQFHDVHIAIEMTKKEIFIESDALEPRMLHAKQTAIASGMGNWYSRIKFLRSGYRHVGAWTGFEVLTHKPAQKHEGENHEFAFQSHGEPKNPLLPVLQIELHTGVKENTTGGIKPSISDDEAIFLWDTVIGSIRPRPSAALR